MFLCGSPRASHVFVQKLTEHSADSMIRQVFNRPHGFLRVYLHICRSVGQASGINYKSLQFLFLRGSEAAFFGQLHETDDPGRKWK